MSSTYINKEKSYRRNLVKKLFEQGKTDIEITYLSEYSESWVRTLRSKFEKAKQDITVLQKPGGSVCRLSADNLTKLSIILNKGSETYGFEGVYWDRKRVKYVIETEFKVVYDIEHISDILYKINFTLQKPLKKDYRQNADKVKIWVEETLPEIKKK